MVFCKKCGSDNVHKVTLKMNKYTVISHDLLNKNAHSTPINNLEINPTIIDINFCCDCNNSCEISRNIF